MKIVFIVLILLVMDFVIFCITHNVTKTYVKEQRVITQNLETLITSVETSKLGHYLIAVKEEKDMYFEDVYLFHDKEFDRDVLVPDGLRREFEDNYQRFEKII